MGVNTGVLSVGREAMETTMDMPIGRETRGTICDVPVGQATVRATYLYEAGLWESPWTYVLHDKGPWESQMTKDYMSHQGRTFTWESPKTYFYMGATKDALIVRQGTMGATRNVCVGRGTMGATENIPVGTGKMGASRVVPTVERGTMVPTKDYPLEVGLWEPSVVFL